MYRRSQISDVLMKRRIRLVEVEKKFRYLVDGEWQDAIDDCGLLKAEKVVLHPGSWDKLPRLRLHSCVADPFTNSCFVSLEQGPIHGKTDFWRHNHACAGPNRSCVMQVMVAFKTMKPVT